MINVEVKLRDGRKWKPVLNEQSREVSNLPRHDELRNSSNFAIGKCKIIDDLKSSTFQEQQAMVFSMLEKEVRSEFELCLMDNFSDEKIIVQTD